MINTSTALSEVFGCNGVLDCAPANLCFKIGARTICTVVCVPYQTRNKTNDNLNKCKDQYKSFSSTIRVG